MTIPKTERWNSNWDFSPADLGEVGSLVEGSPAEGPDCILVSYHTAPLRKDSENTYIVFVKTDTLANQVASICWTVEQLDGKVLSDPKDGTTLFKHSPESEETIVVRAELVKTGGTVLRELRIEQSVKPPERGLEDFLGARRDILGLSPFLPQIVLGGDGSAAREVLGDFKLYIDEAYIKVTDSKKVPRRLLTAITYLRAYQVPKKKGVIGEVVAAGFASTYRNSEISKAAHELNTAEPAPQYLNNGLGVCQLPLFIAAMLPFNDSSAPFLPWREIPGNPDAANNMRNDLFEEFKKLLPDKQIGLFNLLRFPKSNIDLAYKLLNRLKQRWFAEDTWEQVLNKDIALWFIAHDFRVYSAEPSSSVIFGRKAAILCFSPLIDMIDDDGIAARPVHVRFMNGLPTSVIDPIRDKNTSPEPVWESEHFGWNPHNITWRPQPSDGTRWVMLDVGYWGHYVRKKPQRNFGLIEGNNVWLCELRYAKKAMFEDIQGIHEQTLRRLADHPLSRNLEMELYETWGYAMELVYHAVADPPQTGPPLVAKRLTVAFPDMHLPMKWPDLKPSTAYHTNANARRELRKQLRLAQHAPKDEELVDALGRLVGVQTVGMTRAKQLELQQHLWGLYGIPPTPGPWLAGGEYFNKEQFLAEKALVDRKLAIDSCWFYPPDHKKAAEDLPKADPLVEGKDIVESKLIGDPGPAIDLSALLLTLLDLRANHNYDVKVIQVGDLYEIWVNQEWLYKNFPEAEDPPGYVADFIANLKLLGISFGANSSDAYQFRLADYWGNSLPRDMKPDTVKDITIDFPEPYIFHYWPREQLVKRRKTGSALISQDVTDLGASLDRAAQRLKERVDKIRAFSLPVPSTLPPSRERAIQELKNRNLLSARQRKNLRGQDEYQWNALVLDLFNKQDLDTDMLHGNHDGYRSDLCLFVELDEADKAKPWMCKDGIWAEHGNRFDPYNRDGTAFGAGVTNLVYYYFRPHLQNLQKWNDLMSKVVPTFYKEMIPGVAFWSNMVNNYQGPPTTPWSDEGVAGFTISINGHTHTPDLLIITTKS
ncbi:MAG: hypothetical protein KAJ90_00610 [Desulfobacterales bacterium]|nr:hypothetical protein [Desulfobacterales bacterium]